MTNLDTDNTPGIGNKLNRIVHDTIGAVFVQGELAQLTHSAFDNGDLPQVILIQSNIYDANPPEMRL